MSEKENKFILGDNSDGYRRSSEETQPVVLPEYTVRRQQPAPARKPAQRPSAKGRPAPKTRRKTVASKGVKKPVKRKTTGKPEENQVLSRNEKIKLHNEQRRRQKRRKQIINYAAVCLAVLALAVVLSLTVFFQVNEFVIKGESPYTEEEIINACGIRMGENIIRCDAKSVGDKLSQALPYIGSAAVERSASGKVTITVKTVKPHWSVINGEQAVLIDKSGKVLEVGPAEKALEATIVQGVVVAEAVPGQAVVLQEDVPFSYLDTIGKAISSASIDKLTSLNLSDTDYMQALYDGRINIIIGSSDNLTMKLALASEVIKRENSIDPAQYGTIDLTIDDMAYFRPQEEDAPYSAPEEETSAEDTDNTASDTAAVA